MLETSPEAAIGQPLGDLTGRDHPILALLAKVQTSGSPIVEDEVPLSPPFGTARLLDVSVSQLPSRTGEPAGWVVVLRDRTAFADLQDEASYKSP